MRRAGVALLGLVLVAGVATAKPKPPQLQFASPGRIVGAQVARDQLAQRKGQWAALRATATDDAVMFVPQPVVARDWLKKQPEPGRPQISQPHQVFLSCDGSLAVSYGARQQSDGRQGWFTTVWQRQSKGDYKWVMDQGGDLDAPLPAPEMIASSVGYCAPGVHRPPVASPEAAAPAFPSGTRGGWSDDRTLSWQVAVDANCGRALTVSLQRGAGKPLEPVLQKQASAPAGAACPAS